MGQRLVISINHSDASIAKLYFHWSAYTRSALLQFLDLVRSVDFSAPFETGEDKANLIMSIIRYAENNGGGIDGGLYGSEGRRIRVLYPLEKFKDEDIDRNDGLVAITKEGMDSMQSESEGDIIYNIDTGDVSNYVLTVFDSVDELKEYFGLQEEEEVSEKDLVQTPYNLGGFDISELECIVDFLEENRGEFFRYEEFIMAMTG